MTAFHVKRARRHRRTGHPPATHDRAANGSRYPWAYPSAHPIDRLAPPQPAADGRARDHPQRLLGVRRRCAADRRSVTRSRLACAHRQRPFHVERHDSGTHPTNPPRRGLVFHVKRRRPRHPAKAQQRGRTTGGAGSRTVRCTRNRAAAPDRGGGSSGNWSAVRGAVRRRRSRHTRRMTRPRWAWQADPPASRVEPQASIGRAIRRVRGAGARRFSSAVSRCSSTGSTCAPPRMPAPHQVAFRPSPTVRPSRSHHQLPTCAWTADGGAGTAMPVQQGQAPSRHRHPTRPAGRNHTSARQGAGETQSHGTPRQARCDLARPPRPRTRHQRNPPCRGYAAAGGTGPASDPILCGPSTIFGRPVDRKSASDARDPARPPCRPDDTNTCPRSRERGAQGALNRPLAARGTAPRVSRRSVP